MHETFEHTADLGLRVRADDLNSLFVDAAKGLFSMLVVNLDDVHPVQHKSVSLQSDANDFLLFDWLNELLYTFESEQLLLSRFEVEVHGTKLTANCSGEPMDTVRHEMHYEVKAITYHGLKVEQLGQSEWQAEVIVDI